MDAGMLALYPAYSSDLRRDSRPANDCALSAPRRGYRLTTGHTMALNGERVV